MQDTAVSRYLHGEEEGLGGNDDTLDDTPSDVFVLVAVVPASFQACPVYPSFSASLSSWSLGISARLQQYER